MGGNKWLISASIAELKPAPHFVETVNVALTANTNGWLKAQNKAVPFFYTP